MSGLLFNIFAVLPPWGPQSFSPSIRLNATFGRPMVLPDPLLAGRSPTKVYPSTSHLIAFQHCPERKKLGWEINRRKKTQPFGWTIYCLLEQTHWKLAKTCGPDLLLKEEA
ncbi:Hypothetical predicted protein [Podarcis lilfordi]|uniref:Uncharacterized protein n=1 Tax=Podarcis lilfordi TaxID=74358 RepID=A0AA35KXF0_9SAUR|nr:Hypothetical predicted protein [Podarcis lilfordi]